jgi:hypothetical protein
MIDRLQESFYTFAYGEARIVKFGTAKPTRIGTWDKELTTKLRGAIAINGPAGRCRDQKREYPMRLQEWDGTVQTIIAECGHEQKKTDRVLMTWRAKLEKEPTLLQPFQIDEIIREARGRLSHPIR